MNQFKILWKKSSDLDQIIRRNVLGAFGVKGGGMLITFFTLPAYMRFFSSDALLGLWYLLLSLLTWIFSFDFGLGNGLRNVLVDDLNQNNRVAARIHISSTYGYSLVFFIFYSVLQASCVPYLPWNSLLNVAEETIAPDLLSKCIQICLMNVGLQLVFKNITSILYALQKSALVNFLALITNLLLLCFLLLYPNDPMANSCEILCWVHLLATNLPYAIATIFVFFKSKMRDLIPSPFYVSWQKSHGIVSLGLRFFWLQVIYLIVNNLNEMLITQFCGPAYVVEYQVYHKLFMLVGGLFALALSPLWSAITRAQAENNRMWIQKTYHRLCKISLVACVLEFLLVPMSLWLIPLWVRTDFETSWIYALIFALRGSIYIWNNTISVVSNGTGKIALQGVTTTLGAILQIPLAYFFVRLGTGWIGIVVASCLALVPYCLLQPIAFIKYFAEQERPSGQ